MIQKRNAVTNLILSIVTCGIYGIYWFITLTDDSKVVANDQDSPSGGVAFLLTLVTCNIYGWFWAYKLGERVDNAANMRGIGDGTSNSKILFIVLQLFGLGIVNYFIAQDKLNKCADFDAANNGGFNNGGFNNGGFNNGGFNNPQ